MKFLAACLVLLLCSCGSTRVTAVGGLADLGYDLEPAEQHTVVGLQVSQAPATGGFGWELGGQYGTDSGQLAGVNVKADSYEFYAGPRYEWEFGKFHPALSGGITYVDILGNPEGAPTDRLSDLGYYVGLGADYDLGSDWYLGVMARKTLDLNGSMYGNYGSVESWQGLLRFGHEF